MTIDFSIEFKVSDNVTKDHVVEALATYLAGAELQVAALPWDEIEPDDDSCGEDFGEATILSVTGPR